MRRQILLIAVLCCWTTSVTAQQKQTKPIPKGKQPASKVSAKKPPAKLSPAKKTTKGAVSIQKQPPKNAKQDASKQTAKGKASVKKVGPKSQNAKLIKTEKTKASGDAKKKATNQKPGKVNSNAPKKGVQTKNPKLSAKKIAKGPVKKGQKLPTTNRDAQVDKLTKIIAQLTQQLAATRNDVAKLRSEFEQHRKQSQAVPKAAKGK